MKIHHVGIACLNIEEAIHDFKKHHSVLHQSEIVIDELQNAQLCMITSDAGIDFEFISGEQVNKLCKKGISYYHLCYEVDNIDLAIQNALNQDAVMISEPKPAVLFGNRRVAFMYFPYGLIELLEK
mgnify:CR=1 FL=1